jgi:transcriptional regulator with XRE-family HTH domain
MDRETCLSRPVFDPKPVWMLAFQDKSLEMCRLRQVSIEKDFSAHYALGVSSKRRAWPPLDRWQFGERFDALVKAAIDADAAVTARSIASDLRVGEDKISKWRKGKLSVPDPSMLAAIADRFGVSLDFVMRGVRADSTHQKKSEGVTLPVPVPGVQALERSHYAGGPLNEESATDRLPQSASTLDAEVRRILELEEIAGLLQQIDFSATAIKTVTENIRARLGASIPGTASPPRPGRRSDVRRTQNKRRRA